MLSRSVSGSMAGLQQQLVKFIPPVLASMPEVAGGYENCRGRVVLLQDRFSIQKIVGVTVIKSDNNSSTRKLSVLERRNQFLLRNDVYMLSQHLKVLGKMLRRDAQLPRVSLHFGCTMIEQYCRPMMESVYDLLRSQPQAAGVAEFHAICPFTALTAMITS
jgi:hypothetical protein